MEYTAGTYWVSLLAKATAAPNKTTTGHRPVFIFDRTGSGAPYTDFEVRNIRGSLRSGGWSFDVTVFGDADSDEFADGTMVVLFAETWYGNTVKDFGMNHPGRQNIRCVGWIVDETVRKDPESGDVSFSVQGLAGLMKSRQNFSVALDYVSGSPTKWYELKELDTERAIHHYLYWHSTVCQMTDVRVPSVFRAGFPSAYKIKFQDFARGSLWGALSRLCQEAFYVCATDRDSCLWIDFNLQCLEESYRGSVTNVMLLTHGDWTGTLEIRRDVEPNVSIVDFEGMAYDGTTVTPVISIAPGEAPAYMGSPKPSKRHILDPSGDWQAKANLLAGLKYAELNNEFPDISFHCMGDYSISDIVPREYFTLTLVATDTKRGIEWSAQNLVIQQMEEHYDHEAGTCAVSFSFAKATLGTAGVTGDYPPTEPPTPPDNPPPAPIPPPTPGLGGWAKKVYVATKTLGVFYTENFVDDTSSPAGVPTWTAISTGLDLGEDCLGFRGDPFDPEGRQYCLMEDGLYRRTGGAWSRVLAIADLQPGDGDEKFIANGMETDINTQGHVGVLSKAPTDLSAWYNVSYDYGATWSHNLIVRIVNAWQSPTRVSSLAIGQFQGDSAAEPGQLLYTIMGHSGQYFYRSEDGGETWSVVYQSGADSYLGISGWRAHVLVDPMNQDTVYIGYYAGLFSPNVAKSTDRGTSFTKFDLNASETMGALDKVFYHLSVTTGGVVRVGAFSSAQHIHGTWDDGDTWNEVTPQYSENSLGISLLQSAPDNLYLLGRGSGTPDTLRNVIWASIDEGATMTPKSGAHADVIDTGGGDSIPYNCNGIRGILQIWEV